MEEIILNIRKYLAEKADPEIIKNGQRFFKEPVKSHGIRTSELIKFSRERFNSLGNKSKENVFTYCDELWKSGFIEEAFIACNWSYAVRTYYEKDDMRVFERWISGYVNNWATCDTLCNHSVGEFVTRFPECLQDLKRWSHSSNRWMKRAACVSLIIPARKGRFHKEILELAEIVIRDTDDMVQKGYGWMLKAASQADHRLIYNFVMKNREIMPRTAFRYAIEKMPAELRKEAMKR